jgi:hypothetical protein
MKPESLDDPFGRQTRRKEVDIAPVLADQIDEAGVIDRIAIGPGHGGFREEDLVGERDSRIAGAGPVKATSRA